MLEERKMMELADEFITKKMMEDPLLIKKMSDAFGSDIIKMEFVYVKKNNSTTKRAIQFTFSEPEKNSGNNVSPLFYVDEIYESYFKHEVTVEEMAKKIKAMILAYKMPGRIDVSLLENYENVKKHFVISLINAGRNAEMLENTPAIRWKDLAIVAKITVDIDQERGTINVTNDMVKRWGVSKETLFADAIKYSEKNNPAKVISMSKMLGLLSSNEELGFSEEPAMYVVTNENGVGGASVMLYEGVLENLSNTLGGVNLYILPSSVHEVIAVDTKEPSARELQQMVKSVNAECVTEEDFLSDNVYFYNAEKKTLEFASC